MIWGEQEVKAPYQYWMQNLYAFRRMTYAIDVPGQTGHVHCAAMHTKSVSGSGAALTTGTTFHRS